MVSRDRRVLEQLIKQWAQDHTADFTVADYSPGEEGMKNTQGFFTWVIREAHANIDLLSLLDRIELFMDGRRKRKHPDGMYCDKCGTFYEYSEPNQLDGSLICYSCRNSPYH